MTKRRVEDICKSLIASKEWPKDKRRIEELWKPLTKELDAKEQIQLLRCLSKNDYIFKWLGLISHVLPDLASEDQNFTDLLEYIVNKIKGDMAQGEFIRSLINIGEMYPEKAIGLYSRLTKVAGDSLIHYSGLILGGAGKKDFPKVFSIIKNDFQTGKTSTQVACLKALRVGLEKTEQFLFSEEIFALLESALSIQDRFVQIETVQAYIDFDRLKPEICGDRLLEIARKGNSTLRLAIADRLWLDNLQNTKKEIEILRLCSEDNDVRVLESVARVLSRKGQAFLEESLEIVRAWLKRPIYFDIPLLDYYLGELGRNKLKDALEVVERWIVSDRDKVFHFRISRALRELASSSLDELLTVFEKWIAEKDIDFKRIVVDTIIDILLFKKASNGTISHSLLILKQLKEEPIRSKLESNLVTLFGSRPHFTSEKNIIEIISEWASDSDWRIRKTIIPALSVLAEYRVDSEETLHLLINKETKETKITGISTKRIETPEGDRAYKLLEELSRDRNEEVQILANKVLNRVNIRLKEKEERIKKTIEMQSKREKQT